MMILIQAILDGLKKKNEGKKGHEKLRRFYMIWVYV